MAARIRSISAAGDHPFEKIALTTLVSVNFKGSRDFRPLASFFLSCATLRQAYSANPKTLVNAGELFGWAI